MEAAVNEILAAFDDVNLVALGERHWVSEDAIFRLNLIRNPAFAQKVNYVVVEFANPRHQPVLDRFLNGVDVPSADLKRVWQDTTQPGSWDSPLYEEFIRAVRSVNETLSPRHRLRVLAGDYPVDWDAVDRQAVRTFDARDAFAVSVIREQVLAGNRKAIILFGAGHLYRNRPGTIMHRLQQDPRATAFVVVPVAGPDLPAALTEIRADASTPVLIRVAKTLASLAAADVLEKGTKRIKVVDGMPVFESGKPVFIPVFEAGVKLGDLVDACLYFGDKQPEFVEPPTALYEGTDYGREIHRRRSIAGAAMGLRRQIGT
jgi:hypothetical protein